MDENNKYGHHFWYDAKDYAEKNTWILKKLGFDIHDRKCLHKMLDQLIDFNDYREPIPVGELVQDEVNEGWGKEGQKYSSEEEWCEESSKCDPSEDANCTNPCTDETDNCKDEEKKEDPFDIYRRVMSEPPVDISCDKHPCASEIEQPFHSVAPLFVDKVYHELDDVELDDVKPEKWAPYVISRYKEFLADKKTPIICPKKDIERVKNMVEALENYIHGKTPNYRFKKFTMAENKEGQNKKV